MKANINSLLQRNRNSFKASNDAVRPSRTAQLADAAAVQIKDGYDWLAQIKVIPSHVNRVARLSAMG